MEDQIGFKYRAINKRTIELLITGEVYFSSPEQLNDPFDCQIDIRKSLSTAISKVQGGQEKVLLSIQEKLVSVFSQVEEDIRTLGVWSCSIEAENSLMWSHYGDEHRGICLAYKLPDTFIDHTLGEVIGLHPVEYDKAPITNWFIENSKIKGEPPPLSDFITRLIEKLLISKDECWSLEREGRVISKTQGLKEIGKSALIQVCFGLRTPKRDRDLMRKILDNHSYNVTICEMVRSKNDYGLEVKKI